MKSISVFCGSGMGTDPIYAHVAAELGHLLGSKRIRLVYGGAGIGIMGVVADAAMAAGGLVTGIIPEFLSTKEIAHTGVTELITVNSMHDRKMLMHEMSDAVITLPGGWGTMEELFEMLTWSQLGLHNKPISLLNIDGYYDALISLCDHMEKKGFLKTKYRSMLLTANNIPDLMEQLLNYKSAACEPMLEAENT